MGSKVSKTPTVVRGNIRSPSIVSDVSEGTTYHPPPAGISFFGNPEYEDSYSNDNFTDHHQGDYYPSPRNSNVPTPDISMRDGVVVSPTVDSVSQLSASPIRLETDKTEISEPSTNKINDNLIHADVLEDDYEEKSKSEGEKIEQFETQVETDNESYTFMQDDVLEEEEYINIREGHTDKNKAEPRQIEDQVEEYSEQTEESEEEEIFVHEESFHELESAGEFEIQNGPMEELKAIQEEDEEEQEEKENEEGDNDGGDNDDDDDDDDETIGESEVMDEKEDSVDTNVSVELSVFFEKSYVLTFDFSTALQKLRPVREFASKMGFLKTIPTPDVLQRAQKVVKHFRLTAPKSNYGVPVPFPYFPTDKPEQANMEEIQDSLNLKDTRSFSKFMAMLKNLTVIQEEEVKIRFIVKWINKHFDEIPKLDNEGTEPIAEGSPQANIFSKLCKMVNVHCAVIEGQRRTYVLEPSIDAEKRSVKAEWCAVLIKSKWYFVDPSLPAYNELMALHPLQTDMSKQARTEYIHNLISDFYYLPNPTSFVYTHFPNDENWQLLCRPVQESEWQNLVCVSPFYFYHGFELQSNMAYTVTVEGQPLIFSIIYLVEKMFKFAIKTVPSPTKNGPYACIESDLEAKASSIQVYLPKKGNYFLHIFFQDLNAKDSDFLHLCTYNLEVSKGNVSPEDTYFPNPRQHWGPADDTLFTGLVPMTHLTSEIECNTEFLDIVFNLEKKQDLDCSLVDKNGKDFTPYVVFWVHNGKAYIRVSCPGFQRFALHVFVKDKTSGSQNLVCNYYVQFVDIYDEGQTIVALPGVKMLGVTDAGVEAEVNPLSESPFAITISTETKFEFEVKNDDVKMFPTLGYVSDKFYPMDSYILWYSEKGKLIVFINPFRSGMYLFSIQNTEPGVKSTSNVKLVYYNAMISVDIPSYMWSPYAGKMPGVNKMFKVVEPKSGYLCAETEYNFIYEIKDAQDVAIVTSDGWSRLTESTPGLWKSTVVTGKSGTDAKLKVRCDAESRIFTTLLSYKLIAEEDYQERNCIQDLLRKQKEEEREEEAEVVDPSRKLVSFWSKSGKEQVHVNHEPPPDDKKLLKRITPARRVTKGGINTDKGNSNEKPQMDFKSRQITRKANSSGIVKTRATMASRMPIH